MAKQTKSKKAATVKPLKDQDGKTIKSNYSGNPITDGDPNDPDIHDGQAWREGRSVGGPVVNVEDDEE